MDHVSHLPLDALRAVAARFPVRELAVFGSALRDDFGAESDLDLLVDFVPGERVGFLLLARLRDDLAGAAGRPVDLVPKNGLRPRLRDAVLPTARVIYAR